MNRRTFLSNAILASVSRAFRRPLDAQPNSALAATLTLHSDRHVAGIPKDYNGLSYEIAQLSEPEFFSSSNRSLIALLRLLSLNGVLRIGGNSSEFCWWKISESAKAPEVKPPLGPRESNWMPHTLTPITPEAVDRLGEFVNATGWNLIYGLNLGTRTPERATAEAAYVAKVIGPRLKFFQIGNEPEYYRDANNQLRPQAGTLPITLLNGCSSPKL